MQVSTATFALALIAGTVPALFWLWYWIKEDDVCKPPLGLIALTFISGMIMVMFVIPLEKFFADRITDRSTLIVIWAACEEILKFIACAVIVLRGRRHISEPVDLAVYCMTVAFGFAAMENTLFLLKPVELQNATVTLLTTNLRFLGSTLLHGVSTSFIGLMFGLSYYQSKTIRFGSILIGFALAIGLHSIFNFFIMNNGGENFLQVFAFLWVVSIISILVFEKVRRMGQKSYVQKIRMEYGVPNPS